jgi:hypothetical protein
MAAITEPAQHQAVVRVQVLDHQRRIGQAEQGVIADEQRGSFQVQFPQA